MPLRMLPAALWGRCCAHENRLLLSFLLLGGSAVRFIALAGSGARLGGEGVHRRPQHLRRVRPPAPRVKLGDPCPAKHRAYSAQAPLEILEPAVDAHWPMGASSPSAVLGASRLIRQRVPRSSSCSSSSAFPSAAAVASSPFSSALPVSVEGAGGVLQLSAAASASPSAPSLPSLPASMLGWNVQPS